MGEKQYGGSFVCPSCGLPRKRRKFPLTSTCRWCRWKKDAISNTRIEGVPDRIASKVQVTDGCWLWLGALNPRGYAVVGVDGRMPLAHRVIYEYLVGPIPERHHLHHHETCPHNCVNPAHVTPKTLRDHNKLHKNNFEVEWERRRSQTHCKRGHPLAGENLRIAQGRYGDQRVCVICSKIRAANFRERRRQSSAA